MPAQRDEGGDEEGVRKENVSFQDSSDVSSHLSFFDSYHVSPYGSSPASM